MKRRTGIIVLIALVAILSFMTSCEPVSGGNVSLDFTGSWRCNDYNPHTIRFLTDDLYAGIERFDKYMMEVLNYNLNTSYTTSSYTIKGSRNTVTVNVTLSGGGEETETFPYVFKLVNKNTITLDPGNGSTVTYTKQS